MENAWILNIYLHACATRARAFRRRAKFFAFAINFVFMPRFLCHVRPRACLFAANSGDTGTSRLASESQNREPGETDGFFLELLFHISISANGYEHNDYFESELDSEKIVILIGNRNPRQNLSRQLR